MSHPRCSEGGRFALAAIVAAGKTLAVRQMFDASPPGGAERWTRTNHQGEPISLLEGPAVASGLAAGVLWGTVLGCGRGGAARCGGTRASDPVTRAAAAGALAAIGGGAFGLIDDLTEDTSVRTKGIKGHFGALAQGRVTTGALKVLGIGATALLASAVGTPRRAAHGSVRHGSDVITNALLIAASANLLNLLDLRPGRALKAAIALGVLGAGGPLSASASGAVLGAAAAAWPRDLGSKDMLGDGGANALGALVGTRLAFGLPTPAKLVALGAVVGLNVASEKVSFTKVIAETPWLRAIDEFGRRA